MSAAQGSPEEAPDTGSVDLYVFNALAALMSGTAASPAPLKGGLASPVPTPPPTLREVEPWNLLPSAASHWDELQPWTWKMFLLRKRGPSDCLVPVLTSWKEE